MKIKELFKNLEVEFVNESDIEIQNITSNSKKVAPGDLFIAKSGGKYKGSDFIKEVIERGAVAILTSEESLEVSMPQIICKNPAKIEALLADRFYKSPSKKLKMIGITGTNGKTTTSFLIKQLLGDYQCGLIGTIEYDLGNEKIDASLTTPDVVTNHQMLAQMVKNNLSFAVMEATSIALTQNRLDEIDFDLALFTNFTQDHLDYHGDMTAYLNAKSLLFQKLGKDKKAIINIDDKVSPKLVKNSKALVKTYGTSKKAGYRAVNIELDSAKSSFILQFNDENYPVEVPLTGMYNIYNTLLAISCVIELGLEIPLVLERVKKLKAPKGRLEPIENTLGAEIFVDFAHTQDALENVLTSLNKVKRARLITLFGCGGDRDPHKRPLMGKTVSSLSDITIITSDNPRSEEPQQICKEIYAGCDPLKEIYIESDRKKAIALAIQFLQEGDILLIAGRGHEKYQMTSKGSIPFEDSIVTKNILENRSIMHPVSL